MGCKCSKEQEATLEPRGGTASGGGDATIIQTDEELPNDTADTHTRESVYYDALQSFSELSNMPYAPSIKPERRTMGVTISMNDPQSLLVPEERRGRRRSSVRDSVKAAKTMLLRQRPGLQDQRKGYPGELTNSELQACLHFREELKKNKESAYREMVYIYDGVEEEAFALCRFMRARNFVVNDAFAMMAKNIDSWKAAKEHNFYSSFEEIFGCPLSVMWTQFPRVEPGLAKSGAVLSVFKPGRMQIEEGLECIADVPDFLPFAWLLVTHESKAAMADLLREHDQALATVLAERIIIIDLKGIHASLFSSRVMDFLKDAFTILQCFPEILNRMFIVNAPFFFTAIWRVLEVFIDPRTIQKIGIYSSHAKAAKNLLECIDPSELLSDYGGCAHSFDDALEQLQKRDGSCSRQVVERMSVSHKHDSELSFSLTTNETASIDVYTKSDGQADFSLQKNDNGMLVEQTSVKREEGSAKHYSIRIASNVLGPGKFKLVAKTGNNTKHHYLVAVRVAPVEHS